MQLLIGFILCVVLIEESLQFKNRDRVLCLAEAQNAVQEEPDKDLKKVLSHALETITEIAMDLMLELNEEQVNRLVNHYFSGSCGDLKSLFERG